MGFLDNLGNLFGFTDAPTSFNYQPGYASPEYIKSLENMAQYAQNRPDTSSFAEALLRQTQQDNAAQANALAASAKGNVNPALLQRQAMRLSSEANAKAAGQAGLARAQEAMANRNANDQLALAYRQMGLNALQGQSQQQVQLAGVNTQAQQGMYGGLINAIGGAASKAAAGAAHGGVVQGEAKVDGDSEVNDTVDAKLSPGEIVIPRSAAKDAESAKEFIDYVKGFKSSEKEPKGFAHVLAAHKKLEERIKMLESKKGK